MACFPAGSPRLVATLVLLVAALPPLRAGAQQPSDRPLVLVGDMVLGADNLARPGDRGSLASPSGHVGLDGVYTTPWPSGRIPVTFDQVISAAQRAMFFDVCSRWSQVADVECRPADADLDLDALTVTTAGAFAGCNSVVGYSTFYRVLNLDPECWHDSVVLHEIGHAFGLDHEHQRLDRDLFVAVDLSNVMPAFSYAFNLGFGASQGPYDLRSVMHYPWYGFALNPTKPALVPRGAYAPLLYEMGAGRRIGSETFPSNGDAAAMRSIYGSSLMVPRAPGHLRLQSAAGNAVTVAWDAPPTGPSLRQFRIEVGTDAAFVNRLAALSVAPEVTMGSGVLPNGELHIRIVPVGEAGDGEPSNTLSVRMPGGEVIAPPGVPALSALRADANPVMLVWTPGEGGIPTSYTLIAGTAPMSSDFGVFPLGAATSIAGSAPLDVPLYVRVVAANAAGTAVSSVLTLNVPSNPRPLAPSMSTPSVSGNTVSLSWSGGTAGTRATSYLVRVRTSSDGPVVASWSVSTPRLSAPNVPHGAYQISVVAITGTATSDESNKVWVQVP